MTAQLVAAPAAAIVEQLRIQLLVVRRPWHRHQMVPPDKADQTLDLALVVALARSSEAVEKQVMRLQLAEHPRPLSLAISQDARDRNLGVVVKDRLRHLAEEVERRIWPAQNASVVSAG